MTKFRKEAEALVAWVRPEEVDDNGLTDSQCADHIERVFERLIASPSASPKPEPTQVETKPEVTDAEFRSILIRYVHDREMRDCISDLRCLLRTRAHPGLPDREPWEIAFWLYKDRCDHIGVMPLLAWSEVHDINKAEFMKKADALLAFLKRGT